MQKALVLTAPFGKGEYKIIEKPIPTPKPDQILVRIEATGLSPADWKIPTPSFALWTDSYPITLGWDGAGLVEAVGSEVTGYAKGDRVIFQAHHDDAANVMHGLFQQYVVVPTLAIAKISDNVSFVAAATMFSNVSTVANSLFGQKPESNSARLTPPWAGGAGKYAGKSFLCIGGASNVGHYVLQFAKWAGFTNVIATGSLHNEEHMKSYGATHVIDRKLPAEQIIDQVKAIAGGLVDVAFDTVTVDESIILATSLLRPEGVLVVVLYDKDELIRELSAEKKLVQVTARGIMTLEMNKNALDELYAQLPELLSNGTLKPAAYELLEGGLSAVPIGLERLEHNKVSGVKLIVRPQETV